jgi:hypothetical protein
MCACGSEGHTNYGALRLFLKFFITTKITMSCNKLKTQEIIMAKGEIMAY